MVARTTIYVDEALLARIRPYIPARGFSQLVNELLTAHVNHLEQAELEAQMREGYQTTRLERKESNRDCQAVDGEEWPE